jgi:hypothetical protein
VNKGKYFMRIKIITFLLFISMAFFVISNISPWEGAAATSPDGELPANGFYVATNSFPRNTIVDIVNIETNKSTRAIVAAGLNSPGLLAIVSRQAAEIIGMRPGSISRIRITQPSDPIAYLRFMEGLASGIPPYDSGNAITEETYSWDDTGTADSPAARRDTPSSDEGAQTRISNAPPYFLEPEWSGRSGRDIINLPADPSLASDSNQPVEEIAEQTPEEEEETPPQIAEAVPEEEEEAPPQVAEAVPEEEEEAPPQVAEAVPEEEEEEIPPQVAEAVPEEEEEEAPPQVAEAVPEEEEEEAPPQVAEAIPEEEEEEAPPQVAEAVPVEQTAQVAQYNLVPAEKRPPQGTIYGIDPADIIPQIARSSTAGPERVPVLEPVIESISAAERTPTADTNFSVPRIYELDRGSYYVQLAAVGTPESVESAVRLIDRSYGPVVYKDGDNWYRILLGPLNQGESAAVLQRFRSIGYRDAFVTHVR